MSKRYRLWIKIAAVIVAVFVVAGKIAANSNIIKAAPSDLLLRAFDAGPYDTTSDFVEFCDVGQGDSTLIQSDGHTALVDCGSATDGNILSEICRKAGVFKIDYVFISHLHEDHMGGLPGLLQQFEVGNLVISASFADDADTDLYKYVISEAKKDNVNIILPEQNNQYKVGNAEFNILYVPETTNKENNNSIIIRLVLCNRSVLFTGDCEEDEESLISGHNINVKSDVLKLGHHGSATSTSEEFLKEVSPLAAVASAKYDNRYKHPSEKTVSRLNEYGIPCYRTDLDGSVTCLFKNNTIVFKTQREGFG